MTFDVPKGHLLYEKFVPVDRKRLPAHVPVQRVQGLVLGGGAKPDINQLRDAVLAAHHESVQNEMQLLDRSVSTETSRNAAEEKRKRNERDAELMSLREELAKAKAALKDAAHKPTAGGDAAASAQLHKKSIQYETAATSAIDTD